MKLTDSEEAIKATLERNSQYRELVTTAYATYSCPIEVEGINFVIGRKERSCDVLLSCVNDFQWIDSRKDDVKSFVDKVASIASADLCSYRDSTL